MHHAYANEPSVRWCPLSACATCTRVCSSSTTFMATLEYMDIPVGAMRLLSISDTTYRKKGQVNNDIRPACSATNHDWSPVTRSLSRFTKPTGISESLLHRASQRRGSSSSSISSALTSPLLAISLLPQLLLSSSLPPSSLNSASTPFLNATPATIQFGQSSRCRAHAEMIILLRNYLQEIWYHMTTNFKRFVTVIDQYFWLQDRIKEIMLWERVWEVCGWHFMHFSVRFNSYISLNIWPFVKVRFHSRLKLLLPQVIILIGIILMYPYPPTSSLSSDPLFSTADNTPSSSSSVLPIEDYTLAIYYSRYSKPNRGYVSYNISGFSLLFFAW